MSTEMTRRWHAANAAALRACERSQAARATAQSIALDATTVRAVPQPLRQATVLPVPADVHCADCDELRSVVGQLEQALVSRDVIGQAKGVLMALRGVDEGEAFALLRDASQHRNERLRVVAEDVARTGSLDRWP